MAYRWKNYGTPIEAEQAQQMQGYRPNYAGRSPFDISPEPTQYDVVDAGAYGGLLRSGNIEDQQSYANNQIAQQEASLKTQIMQLESELVQIDAQIAEIEKTMPKGVSDAEWEIAAKRAEIGDNSAYDNLVSRGYNQMATARSAEDNIKNELYNAEKLTWGLNVKSDEEKEMAANQIAVSLRKAEDMAAKNGTELPEGYYRLKAALKNYLDKKTEPLSDGVQNSRVYENTLYTKARNKTLRDADIKAAEKYLADNPGSEDASRIKTFIGKYANQTVEARERDKVNRQKADKFYNNVKNMSAFDVKKELDKLTKKELKNLTDQGYSFKYDGDKAYISPKSK